jgi:hypothetical protein
MTGRRSKFRWSDEEIRAALGPRQGIPGPNDEEIIRDLAEVGAKHMLARRKGGRKQRMPQTRGEVRRIVIEGLFKRPNEVSLPTHLREHPTSHRTLARIHAYLKECGLGVSEATVLKDVKKLQLRKSRGK